MIVINRSILSHQFQEAKAGYTLLVVAIYWLTESLPLGITALIPFVMLPLFGIVRSKTLCMNYMKVGMTGMKVPSKNRNKLK